MREREKELGRGEETEKRQKEKKYGRRKKERGCKEKLQKKGVGLGKASEQEM